MEQRLKLAIDIDDTLIDFLVDFLDYYNHKNRTNFKKEDFKSYRWWEALGVSKETAYSEADGFIKNRMAWFTGLGSDNFYGLLQIKFDRNAEKYLMFLGKRYELFGLTDRSLELEDETFEISSYLYSEELESRGLEGLILPYDHIFHTKNENGLYTPKHELCKKLEIKAIIDDNLDVALSCAENGILAFVPEKPWNILEKDHALIYRGSLKQIARQLKTPDFELIKRNLIERYKSS